MERNLTLARLDDPLSEVTRRERRMLLGVSTLGLSIGYANLLPSHISMLGIELASADQAAVLQLIILVVAYYLIAFVCYSGTDYLRWLRLMMIDQNNELEQALPRRLTTSESISGALEGALKEVINQDLIEIDRKARHAAIARGIFEFVLPIIVAAAAIYFLFSTMQKLN